MKLSEYIEKLNGVLAEHGDVSVIEAPKDGNDMEPLEEIAGWRVTEVIRYTNIGGVVSYDYASCKRDWMKDVEEFKAFLL